jgi:fructokinase
VIAIELEINSHFNKPVAMGAGLVALDIVISKRENEARFWVGGSCGNILTILAYFGWRSFPIAYLGKDQASEIMFEDLNKWGVNTDFIFLSDATATPIIVERIKNRDDNSHPTHVFEFKCPFCGSMLPRNRPLPKTVTEMLIGKMPASNVFYFDRVSGTNIALAKIQKSKGALIIFEPHRIMERALFKECLELSDIVKYSSEQIQGIRTKAFAPLEIQTLGAKGLKYRIKNDTIITDWKKIDSLESPKIVDSAGAGDWCTAGLIHCLGQKGSGVFLGLPEKKIIDALTFGQCLSAVKCAYEGPRGIMYYLEKTRLQFLVESCYSKADIQQDISSESVTKKIKSYNSICPHCSLTYT